ncbi:unnamed protein product [Prorocentrum cordatum]|uniref:Uncharacterized protein n=1 Tax=Prorocentrum cordatum TaxID=2364126 RepID=A0ABN9U942_9DINO|nr:unnamed protein product [Polarella glacialis]
MVALPQEPSAAAGDIAKVLREPLEHDVTAEALVREAPSRRSPVTRRLQAGQVVRGYPAGGWLLLADGEVTGQSPGWARIGLRGGGVALQLLAARWAGIRVERSFFEALELSWPGIPGDFVAYSVQWRPRDTAAGGGPTPRASSPGGRAADAGSSSGGEGLLGASGGVGGTTECTSPGALLHGLPAGSPLRVRVVASVSGPEVDFAELLVPGPWVEMETSALSEELPDRDMLGARRGGCGRTGCVGFVAAASFYEASAEQCRRCGASHEEHLALQQSPQPDAAPEASVPEDADPEGDKDEVGGSSVADQDAPLEPSAQGGDLLDFASEAPSAAGDLPDAGAGVARAVTIPETGVECLHAAGGPIEWWEGSGEGAEGMGGVRDAAALETDEACRPVDGESAAWWEGFDEEAVGEVAPELLPPPKGSPEMPEGSVEEYIALEGDTAAWWEGSDEGAGGEAGPELLRQEGQTDPSGMAGAALCGAGAFTGPLEDLEQWAEKEGEEEDTSAHARQEGPWDEAHGAGDAGDSPKAVQVEGLEVEATKALAKSPTEGAADALDEATPCRGGGTELQELSLEQVALLRPRARLDGPWFLLPSVGTWRGARAPQARAGAAAAMWPPGWATAAEAVAVPSAASGGETAAAASVLEPPTAAKLGRCAAAADNAQRVLGHPVEYVVAKAGGAVAREEPHKAARERAVLEAGSLVAGFPGGGWLRIARAQPPSVAGCWVFVGSQLAAVALQPRVAARFSEALEVQWPGLRHDLVGYSVEWRPVGQPPAEVALPSSRARVSLKPLAIASGIPAALGRVQVRVGARVCAPPAASAAASDVQLLGAWSEEEALAQGAPGGLPGSPDGPHLDPFSTPRGACAAASCPGYVPIRLGAGSPQRGALRVEDAARCWRCGHSCREHALVGGGSGRAAAKAEPKGADSKEAASARPEPGGAGEEQSRAVVPAAPLGLRRYEVVHRAVHVRDQPSRHGKSVGVVREGQLIAGVPSNGWLRLDEDSRAAALLHGSRQPAWCLIDGSELGLGCQPGTSPYPNV